MVVVMIIVLSLAHHGRPNTPRKPVENHRSKNYRVTNIFYFRPPQHLISRKTPTSPPRYVVFSPQSTMEMVSLLGYVVIYSSLISSRGHGPILWWLTQPQDSDQMASTYAQYNVTECGGRCRLDKTCLSSGRRRFVSRIPLQKIRDG